MLLKKKLLYSLASDSIPEAIKLIYHYLRPFNDELLIFPLEEDSSLRTVEHIDWFSAYTRAVR